MASTNSCAPHNRCAARGPEDRLVASRAGSRHDSAVPPVSIFDMDRTLTRRGTWLPWLVFWVAREAPWRALLWPLAGLAALAHAVGLISRGRLKLVTQGLLMGTSVRLDRVAAAAEAFAARIVANAMFAGAVACLAADRAAGRRLVIATASNDYYARAIAARLGVDDVVATEIACRDGGLLPHFTAANCYGAAKRAQVEAWLEREGLAAARVRFYSDHISDLPMFDRADEPVAANPSAALRAVAQARGWRIVDWGEPHRSWLERA